MSEPDKIVLIIAPPRSSSTALARLFWEHPSASHYCHEPFERHYYYHEPVPRLNDFRLLALKEGNVTRPALLIVKEMSFQLNLDALWDVFPADKTSIVMLHRHPLLALESRVRTRSGQQFPLKETGFEDLERVFERLEKDNVPFGLLDAADMRDRPLEVLPQVFATLGLQWNESMIRWSPRPDLNLDNMDGGRHADLYRRVLSSTGVEPATERIPNIDELPEWLQEHAKWCVAQYEKRMRKGVAADNPA